MHGMYGTKSVKEEDSFDSVFLLHENGKCMIVGVLL